MGKNTLANLDTFWQCFCDALLLSSLSVTEWQVWFCLDYPSSLPPAWAPLGWAPCCPAAGGEMLVLIQPPQLARGEAERSMGTQQSREALFLISPASSEKKEQLFTVLPAHLPRTIKLGNGSGTLLQCTQPRTFPLHLLPLPLLAEIAVSGDEIQLTQQCRVKPIHCNNETHLCLILTHKVLCLYFES